MTQLAEDDARRIADDLAADAIEKIETVRCEQFDDTAWEALQEYLGNSFEATLTEVKIG